MKALGIGDAVRTLRSPVAVLVLFAACLSMQVARADNKSGITTTGTPSACYEDDLKKVIEDCIAANMAATPKGNPGPFTQGYDSIIVLGGQCYSGGFSSLTSIGDDVVVGSASSATKESNNEFMPTAAMNRMKWVKKLLQEINSDPNRKIKDILDAVDTANPDPAAGTPAPSTSTGGDGVTMGDPMDDQQPARSFHAILFAGKAEVDTGTPTDRSSFLRVAHMAALNDMETALKDKLNVPAANIEKKFGGSYAELKALIEATWNEMNDNEQFILFIADHGDRCCITPPEDVAPGAGGNSNVTSIVTPSYMGSPFIEFPRIDLNTLNVFNTGDVLLNGQSIGVLTPSTGLTLNEYVFAPSLLAPVGQFNQLEILIPFGQIQWDSIALATGPVAGGQLPVAAVPLLSARGLVLLTLATAAAGLWLMRRRHLRMAA